MRIISKGSPEAERQMTCRNCGCVFAYFHRDTETVKVSCLGESDTVRMVKCPECSKEIQVEWFEPVTKKSP